MLTTPNPWSSTTGAQPVENKEAAPTADAALPPAADAALRADIRRLGTLLGYSLTRQEGRDLLDLVERVRTLVRSDADSAAAELADLDVATATKLARAFSMYFHLANITEQVHRARELRRVRAAEGGWLDRAARLIAERGVEAREISAVVDRLAVRPVFTAHPTEAARRSILSKLRAVADELDAEATAVLVDGAADRTRTDRRLAELLDLLWQTDELRLERPEPTDEARNAVYYLADLARHAAPRVLEDLADTLLRFNVDLPPTARPLTFGSWIGGDRDGNPYVTPTVTRDVLLVAHEHGIRAAEAVVDSLIDELSVSRGLARPRRQRRGRHRRAARAGEPLPPDQRRGAVPAQGPVHQAEAGQHQEAARRRRAPRGGPGLSGYRRTARRSGGAARLTRPQRRAAAGHRPHRVARPHGRGVRSAPGDPRRARARRRPPRGAGPALPTSRRGGLPRPGSGRPNRGAPPRAGRAATAGD